MKTSKLKLLALATVMVVSIHSTQAFEMDFRFDTPTEFQLVLPGGTNTNGRGRVWLGNFGSTSFGTVSSSLLAGNGQNLLNDFNPLASFGVDSDGYFNGNRVVGATGVTDSSFIFSGKVELGLFAGQDAYLLVLNSYSDAWQTAKSEWLDNGSLTAILVKSGNSFDSTIGESSDASTQPGPKNFAVSTQNGTLLLGNYNVEAGTITASSVPEPSVGALLLLGGSALALIRARRNRE